MRAKAIFITACLLTMSAGLSRYGPGHSHLGPLVGLYLLQGLALAVVHEGVQAVADNSGPLLDKCSPWALLGDALELAAPAPALAKLLPVLLEGPVVVNGRG